MFLPLRALLFSKSDPGVGVQRLDVIQDALRLLPVLRREVLHRQRELVPKKALINI